MKFEVKKILEEELGKYKIKEIRIYDKSYPLYLIPELSDEDLNIFDGFLFVETEDGNEVSHLKTRYSPPVSGYAPRLGFIIYGDFLLVKDYRKNKHIIKTLKKINKTFLNKLKKALNQPNEGNFDNLFNRTDVIEEFYILYKKAKEYLLKNIKGIPEEEKREEFVNNFMMQMLTLWYLQERGFFNNDKNYFITKFKELKQRRLFNEFKSYYEFLTYLFDKISGYEDKQYYEDEVTGKVVIVGPAVFLNGEHKGAISLPDECFYKEGITDVLITTPPKNVSQEVPLLNLFESRDWTEGNIDEFVLGAIYEKLINYDEKKKTGTYYTPEEITSYICKNTIEPYLVDRVNEEFKKNFETIEQIIESSDKKIILYLFKQLKEIKILDPAVGSAHFLESAINVLVSVYEKIWKKAKELGIREGLEIISADEKGEIREIDLLEVEDEEQFNLLVKFFIILSKNVYGVDINPSALKVARARLFLTLAKHFKIGKDKNVFMRFPNVHFNLRTGNSLIGYIEFKEKPVKKNEQLENNQMSIFEFLIEEEQTNYITEKIGVVTELKEYLKKIAESLNLGNIMKEIEELNKILSKSKIGWDDFEKVLRTKEKLITILIASLNSKYAKKLNDLLREITDLFNQKLDEKFAEEHKIKLEELKKIKTFHWIFEFPEVFLRGNPGFDIVLGNPPYGDILNDVEKEIVKTIYPFKVALTEKSLKGSHNAAAIFIERSYSIMKHTGKFSFIVPNTIARKDEFQKLRWFILSETYCYELADVGNPFKHSGVNLEMIIIFYERAKLEEDYKITILSKRFKKSEYARILKSKFENVGWFAFYYDEILEYLLSKPKLGLHGKFFGAARPSKLKVKISDIGSIPVVKGNGIGRYHLDKIYYIEKNENVKLYFRSLEYPALVLPEISGFIQATIISNGKVLPISGVEIWEQKNKNLNKKYILVVLNSKLLSYYYHTYIINCSELTTHLNSTYLERLPFTLRDNQQPFIILADHMLFLNATEERRNKEKELIEFIDKHIIDSLVYELYFKEKFAEDGLYPEPREYLLRAVSKYLKPINYNRWAELYWKKQIEGNLTKDEGEELETLEKENMKTIVKVYESLKEDKEVRNWIEKIKSHEWVKVIEGEK